MYVETYRLMDIGFADGSAQEEHVHASCVLCVPPSALVERWHLYWRIAALSPCPCALRAAECLTGRHAGAGPRLHYRLLTLCPAAY